jgi:hypothetical protein
MPRASRTWIEAAIRAGERFAKADLLIAALAAERGLKRWSLDIDFQRMAELGIVELYRAIPCTSGVPPAASPSMSRATVS